MKDQSPTLADVLGLSPAPVAGNRLTYTVPCGVKAVDMDGEHACLRPYVEMDVSPAFAAFLLKHAPVGRVGEGKPVSLYLIVESDYPVPSGVVLNERR